MNSKPAILAVMSLMLVVGVLWMTRDSEDQQVVEELARQQSRLDQADSLKSADGGHVPGMFKLSESLTASKSEGGDLWFVSRGDSTFIELPFVPTSTGELPPTADRSARADAVSSDNPGYLGAAACADCHPQKHAGFVETAHHRTSGLVDAETIQGYFSGPASTVRSRDPDLSIVMRQDDDRFLQEVSYDDWKLEVPMDVFTGSSKMGQTLLYWHGDALYQAHVSYLTKLDRWIHSPGYDDNALNYARRIRVGCLECHITYIDQKRAPNFYHRDSAIFGISCERCHGPGRQHVEYHRENPEEKKARYIIHPASLPREQQLDTCAQCHSGSFNLIGEAFSFHPGKDLDAYHKLRHPDRKSVGGIHTSNQLPLLRMSRCFQESEMTCATCHDPHQNQHGDTAAFTERCLDCHQPTHCGMSETLGQKISEDCISCHMPIAANEDMQDVAAGAFTIEMVDHYIRIDREATEKYLKKSR